MKSIENVGHTRRLVTLASAMLMLACGTLVGLLAQQRAANPDLPPRRKPRCRNFRGR